MPDIHSGITPSPFRRALALGGSAVLGVGLAIGVRGTESAAGLLIHIEPAAAVRDVAALCLAALAVGIFVPLVAGNYIPGLPARALCVTWAGLAGSLRPASGQPAVSPEVWTTIALAELLVLAAGVWIVTTACWLVDTRITFPRLYPDPADRPPAKHTTARDVLVTHLPNALGISLGVGVLYRVVPSQPELSLKPFLVALGAAFVSHTMQRIRPSRGSIWVLLGVIGGVALALSLAPAGTPSSGGPPEHLFTCAVAGYAAILLRTGAVRPTP